MASLDVGFNKLAHWTALNPAIGEVTRVLVHRYCRPGRCLRSTLQPLADALAEGRRPLAER